MRGERRRPGKGFGGRVFDDDEDDDEDDDMNSTALDDHGKGSNSRLRVVLLWLYRDSRILLFFWFSSTSPACIAKYTVNGLLSFWIIDQQQLSFLFSSTVGSESH